MAVVQELLYRQQNDNKALILTDTSSGLNIPAIAAATLDVEVTKSDGTTSVKTPVNLLVTFGPFAVQSDMIYTITAALLGDTADSELVDGIYELTYTLDANILVKKIAVVGQIKKKVYEKLRVIPNLEPCNDKDNMIQIREADLYGAYLSAIEAYDGTSQDEEALSALATLERLLLNDDNITW